MVSILKVPSKAAVIIERIRSQQNYLDELKEFERTRGIRNKEERITYHNLPKAIDELYQIICNDFPELKKHVEIIIGIQYGLSEQQRIRLGEIDRYIENLRYSSK